MKKAEKPASMLLPATLLPGMMAGCARNPENTTCDTRPPGTQVGTDMLISLTVDGGDVRITTTETIIGFD